MTCSGEQKVTTMILKVDLQCCQCYKKIKKILCKFPQIRDQIYDEKQNTVTITVVCCSPEKIMDKLCCKGRKTIKSIEIKEPAAPQKPLKSKPDPAPTEPEKPKVKPKPAAPAPEPENPKPNPTPAPAPVPVPVPVPVEKPPPMKKNGSKNGSKSESAPKPKPAAPAPAPAPAPAATPAPAPAPEPVAQWVPGYPPQAQPQMVCCAPCYEGRLGGPCYQGYQYGRPHCPPGYYATPCDYFSEENPSACAIM